MRKLLHSLILGIQLALAVAVPSLLPAEANAAITFVGAGTAANAIDGGSISPTLHASTAEGNAVICSVGQKNGAADAISNTGATYTKLFDDSTTGREISYWCKIADAGEGTPSFSSSDTTSGSTIIGQCATLAGTLNTCTGIVAHSAEASNSGTASITMPSLVVTTDNTVVIYAGFKEQDWNAENPIIGASDALTEIGQPERTTSAQVGMVWAYRIQTTAATVTPGDATLTENAADAVSIAVSIKPAAVTPLYTSDPAVQTRTTSSLVFRATTDTTGTRYGARLTDGSGAPTCDQLEAQTATGGVQYGSQAATATVASDLTLSSITDGTVTDYYECMEDGSGNDSAVKSIADVYKTPAWTVSPTVTAQGTGDYTITKTLDGAGSCTAVAILKDATPPSVAQALAGNGADDQPAVVSATDASCEAGTLTLGSSLTRPVHDVYVAATYGSQNSALTTLADEMLDAPTGYQYDLLASVSATSPCKDLNDIPISPTIAAADVTKWPATTSPSGYAFTAGTDCETQYTDPAGTRQTATLDVYDTSAGDWMSGGPTTVYFNNSAPACTLANCEFDSGETLINGVAMASVDMNTWFSDADTGDVVTITTSDTGTGTGTDKRPASTSIASGVQTGTLSCASGNTTGTWTTTATDEAGDTRTVAVTWTCYDQVLIPSCVGLTVTACDTAIGSTPLTANAAFTNNSAVASGIIASQSIVAGTEVNPFTSFDIDVSLGSAVRVKRRTLGLGVGVGRFMPEVSTDGVFDDQFFMKSKWRF